MSWVSPYTGCRVHLRPLESLSAQTIKAFASAGFTLLQDQVFVLWNKKGSTCKLRSAGEVDIPDVNYWDLEVDSSEWKRR